MSAVAVIGLGRMGSRIARRVLDARHELVVWNRTAERTVPLVADGAVAAATPADAARRVDFVLTMVADADALREVTEGADGIAAGVDSSTILVEMSTVGPPAVARLAAALPAGTELVDAPVLGSLPEVEAGALTIFAGGSAAAFERVRPVLAALGTPVHVGPLGAGAAAKLVANASLLGAVALVGEALALAAGLGLSREAAWAILAATPLGSQAERRRPAVESGAYPTRFALSLARKDATLVADAAASAGVDLRLAAAVRTWLADAEAAGRGEQDYAAMLAHILSGNR